MVSVRDKKVVWVSKDFWLCVKEVINVTESFDQPSSIEIEESRDRLIH